MQPWSTFYATIGAASATLLGLLFVAVSVNASAALGRGDRLISGMTEQAFQNYLAILLVALLALFPDMSTSLFGDIVLASLAGRAIWIGIRLFQMFSHSGPRQSLIFALRRYASTVLGFGLLIFASARMALGHSETYDSLAASMLILLFSAMTVSWDLLRRIANPKSP